MSAEVAGITDEGAAGVGTKPKLSEEKVSALLETARKNFEHSASTDKDNRDEAKRDVAFVWERGAQWPKDITDQRNTAWQPCLEINQLPQFIKQVVNDQRQNRPGIKISPASGDASKAVAKIIQGMIRHIEYDSQAEAAYDSAFEAAVTSGRGYIRVLSQYEGDDTFDQKLVIKRVADPMSVYPDPDYQEPDASDMQFCFVTETMTKDTFESRYPDAAPLNWDLEDCGQWFDDKDTVRVADWYRRVSVKRTLVAMSDGAIGWKDDLPKAIPPGVKVVKERESEDWSVEWYKVAGGQQILEKFEWPGSTIPVVICLGDEHWVGGKRIVQGLIRRARDPQTMYNYFSSASAERIALAPKAPWVMAEGQDEGYENQWQQANRVPYSRLIYKPTSINGQTVAAPQRQNPVSAEMGLIDHANQCKQDLRATIGIYDPSLGNRSNEISGRAIIAREKQGDTGTFHFVDNLSRAIALVGRICVEVLPDFYDTQRIVTTLDDEDQEDQVVINQAMPHPDDATKSVTINNLGAGKYAVVVEAGPSFATKREESRESMMAFVQAVPAAGQVAGDLIAKAQDWPDADLIAERLELILPPPIQAAIAAKKQGKTPPDPAMLQQLQQLQQQLQQMGGAMQQAQAKVQELQSGVDVKKAAIAADMELEQYKAEEETKRTIAKAQTDAEVTIRLALIERDTKLRVAQINGEAQMMTKGVVAAMTPLPDQPPADAGMIIPGEESGTTATPQ